LEEDVVQVEADFLGAIFHEKVGGFIEGDPSWLGGIGAAIIAGRE